MTTYRRLSHRDYSTKALVSGIETRIKVYWQMMQEERKKARSTSDVYMRDIYHESAIRLEASLKLLLAVRAEAR